MIINRSKTYILPLLYKLLNIENILDIRNTYLYSTSDSSNDYFYVEYIIKDKEIFDKSIETISENKYIKSLYIKDNICIFVLKVPDEHKTDIIAYEFGKFSALQLNSKTKIIRFLQKYSKNSRLIADVYGIIYRTDKRKEEMEEDLDIKLSPEDELASLPNLEKEVIDLNGYKEINIK